MTHEINKTKKMLKALTDDEKSTKSQSSKN